MKRKFEDIVAVIKESGYPISKVYTRDNPPPPVRKQVWRMLWDKMKAKGLNPVCMWSQWDAGGLFGTELLCYIENIPEDWAIWSWGTNIVHLRIFYPSVGETQYNMEVRNHQKECSIDLDTDFKIFDCKE